MVAIAATRQYGWPAMTEDLFRLEQETARRRTFAIISHPDAGKTTLTEKLLLLGGAIHLAGSVKSRKASRHARSDWMELEKQRGISVTTSVLQFDYHGLRCNLLDTPGHQDFSEDTYRTLTAADSAVMLIDAAKSVEPQTRKLFEVCHYAKLPVITFINKCDRPGLSPLDLLDDIETALGIRSCPINWPIEIGPNFRAVYDRQAERLHVWDEQANETIIDGNLESDAVRDVIGADAARHVAEEVALLDVAGDPFDLERIRNGELTPVFFGSAHRTFGIRPFLDALLELAPPPVLRNVASGDSDPNRSDFSGFIFKIQANMDPQHRDRFAFLRVCTGRFYRGMLVQHPASPQKLRITNPHIFLANERILVEEAWPGDVVGIFAQDYFRIGDSLYEGAKIVFRGMPTFAPENFATLRIPNALKRKQLDKGLDQLVAEGAIQMFRRTGTFEGEPILAAVGELQFDVLLFRLQNEYGVEATLRREPFTLARWVFGTGFDPKKLNHLESVACVKDRDGRDVVLLQAEWSQRMVLDRCKGVELLATAPPLH